MMGEDEEETEEEEKKRNNIIFQNKMFHVVKFFLSIITSTKLNIPQYI